MGFCYHGGMEHLTKQQLILVALLVSFMTSISTGIVTVALIDQAPQGVTQTINRVVERTIEKVVEAENKAQVQESVKTVVKVVSQEEAIPSAVEKNAPSIVRIYGTVSLDPPSFMTVGVIVLKDGLIVAPRSLFLEGGSYLGILPDGTKVDLDLIARNEDTATVYFRIKQQDPKKPVSYPTVVFSDISKLKIGQGVIVIGGEDRNTISHGLVTGIVRPQIDAPVQFIETDIAYMKAMSPAINYGGEFLGLKIARDSSIGTVFIPSSEIKRQIELITLPAPKKTE